MALEHSVQARTTVRYTKSRRIRWVLLLALVALTVAAVGAGCADRFILPPVPRDVAHDGSERRMLRTGKNQVEVFVARSPGAATTQPTAYVLRFTGDAAGAAKFTASRWQHLPIEAWVVNYPGYGQSTGPRTLRELARVSLLAFDELSRVAEDRPIFVEGFSLGTTPALCVAARRPVAGVILQNPPPLKQLVMGAHGWWNLWLLAGPVALSVPEELDSVDNAKRCQAPAVFLVAQGDEVIPPAYQRKVIDAYAGGKRIIKLEGARHVQPLTSEQEEQLHEQMGWLVSGRHSPRPSPGVPGEREKR